MIQVTSNGRKSYKRWRTQTIYTSLVWLGVLLDNFEVCMYVSKIQVTYVISLLCNSLEDNDSTTVHGS